MPAHGNGYLVETAWLAANLDNPNLRILDCTVEMHRGPDGGWQPISGRAAYDAAHIPNTLFVDLLVDLKDQDSDLNHMLPPSRQFADAMGTLGIDNDTRVIVYVTAVPWWATRMWWMLRAFGHDNVAVLNGGLRKWQTEGRAVSTEISEFGKTAFAPRYRPELVADKDRVRTAVDRGSPCLVNALSPQLLTGKSDLGYARPGRIANSVNLSALSLLDQGSGTYLAPDALRDAVRQSIGPDLADVICYCGGGIAATMDAFVLALLGYETVAVYDGSLEEWSADPKMPMDLG